MQITRQTIPPHRLRAAWEWIWKSAISGLSGSTASTALMYFKARAGILPSFQPYENFQMAAGYLIGHDVNPKVLWLVSFFNGRLWSASSLAICIDICLEAVVPQRGWSSAYAVGS
jgi:hypothetical protein